MIVYKCKALGSNSTELFSFYIARNSAKYVHLEVPLTIRILLFNFFIVSVRECYCLHS